MAKPTLARLEGEVLAFLRRDTVTIKIGRMMDNRGIIAFVGDAATITVDPFNGGILETVIHELVHAAKSIELELWGGLEETLVESLEAAVLMRVNANDGRYARWRRVIEAKLAKGAG